MSSRTQLSPFPVITAASMASNITSDVTIVQKLSLVSYTVTWSGSTPVGTIAAQVSNDYSLNADGTVKNAGSWVDMPLSSTPAISGNTGTGFIDIDATGAYAMRLVYTRSSGTGTMNATIAGKVS